MPVSPFLLKKFEHTAENIAFNKLIEQLNNSTDQYLVIGNCEIERYDIDAIVFKKDAIIIIDFKNYGGKINFSENEEWIKSDGTIVSSGSHRNPLIQVKKYKTLLSKFLNENYSNPNNDYGHINSVIIFSEEITINKTVFPGSIKPWFYVESIQNSLKLLDSITSIKIEIDIEKIKNIFGLNNYPQFNLTDYKDTQIQLVSNLQPGDDEDKNLINYYISCLELSNLKELIFKRTDTNTYYNFNFNIEIDLGLQNNIELKEFILRELRKPDSKNLFYGVNVKTYTNFNKVNGNLVPIKYIYPTFFSPVEIELQNNQPKYLKFNLNLELNTIYLKRSENRFTDAEEIGSIKLENDTLMTLNEKENHLSSQDIINNDNNTENIFFFSNNTGATRDLISELNSLKEYKFNQLITSKAKLLLSQNEKLEFNKTTDVCIPSIEITQLNNSQEKSICAALKNPLTVITGPPGTGKSQLVINLIVNAIFEGKSVLFSSNNNFAVDVVKKRIFKLFHNEIFKDLFLRTGNKTTINNELLNQLNVINANIINFSFDLNHFNDLNSNLKEINQNILDDKKIIQCAHNFVIEFNNKKQVLDEYLMNLLLNIAQLDLNIEGLTLLKDDVERFKSKNELSFFEKLIFKLFPRYYINKYFNKYSVYVGSLSSELKDYIFKKFQSDQLNFESIFERVCFLINIKQSQILFKDISIFIRANLEINNNILRSEDIENHLNNIVIEFENKIENLKIEKIRISNELIRLRFSKFIKENNNISNQINRYQEFINAFVNFVNNGINFRERNTYREFNDIFVQILKSLKIWMSTNLSIRKSIPFEQPGIFDLLIIDEASQCDIPSSIPLFYRAKQVVVIGDDLQLQHISGINRKEDVAIGQKLNLSEKYYGYYSDMSLFRHCLNIINNLNQSEYFLDQHYRSVKHIMDFSNINFYFPKKGKQMINRKININSYKFEGIFWKDVQCNGDKISIERNKNKINDREVDEILNIYDNLLNYFKQNNLSVGITTPFRNQANLIHNKLLMKNINEINQINVLGNTIHKFQGDERDIIFFSPVISIGSLDGAINFINFNSPELLNVAISRARIAVIIVGDKASCSKAGGLLQNLVNYSYNFNLSEILN